MAKGKSGDGQFKKKTLTVVAPFELRTQKRLKLDMEGHDQAK